MRGWWVVGLVGCSPGVAEITKSGTALEGPEASVPGTTPSETTSEEPPTDELPQGDDDDELPADTVEFHLPGPYDVEKSTHTFEGSCNLEYDQYLPVGYAPDALVVVAHGLQRSKAQVAGHAEQWASWGLAVVAPNLCAAEIWNADHPRNADDLLDLGRELADGAPIVYAGHSAGGLASFLAAANDSQAVGHLGLDLVDAFGMGVDGADGIQVPAYGLVAEPEMCNDSSNGVEVYDASPGGLAVRVAGADHCDFESPTDAFCSLVCASGPGPDTRVHDVITGMSTAYLMWITGEDSRGIEWWTPGETAWEDMADAGAISEP